MPGKTIQDAFADINWKSDKVSSQAKGLAILISKRDSSTEIEEDELIAISHFLETIAKDADAISIDVDKLSMRVRDQAKDLETVSRVIGADVMDREQLAVARDMVIYALKRTREGVSEESEE